jgi:hypothetical protein
MPFVIVRNHDKMFVCPAGQKNSYTHNLQYAVVFATKEEAEKEKCGHETVVDVMTLLERNR